MEFLKRLYKKYMFGYSHNCFPIGAYGFFGERKPKQAKDIHCPLCGYYCSGEGGIGCIDKPALVDAEQNVDRMRES